MSINHTVIRAILPVNKDGCIRCTGTGYLMQHKHVIEGVCFKCHGTGLHTSDENHPSNIAFDKKIEEAIKRREDNKQNVEDNSSFTAMLKRKIENK